MKIKRSSEQKLLDAAQNWRKTNGKKPTHVALSNSADLDLTNWYNQQERMGAAQKGNAKSRRPQLISTCEGMIMFGLQVSVDNQQVADYSFEAGVPV